MKYAFAILGLILITLLLNSCAKDPEFKVPVQAEKGTFAFNIDTKVGSQNFVIGQNYYDIEGYRYNVATFKYYLSKLSLIKEDGSLYEVKDIALIDYEGNNLGDIETVMGEVPVGNYSGIKVWFGVDSVLNFKGPNDYPNSHPLSVAQQTYWDWNTNYRFMILEGICDTILNDTMSIPPTSYFTYHPGTMPLYKEVVFPARAIAISKDNRYDYNVKLDVNKIFYSTQDTITMHKRPVTHTVGAFDLAEEISENFTHAFSVQ
ncbi:MAG: MbnP family protein [Chitinophagales bacterium]|nr:MbnP family protein [Chitinophagales bacterium]